MVVYRSVPRTSKYIIALYSKLLELGQASVSDLSSLLGIPKSSCRYVLGILEKQGFVEKRIVNGRAIYVVSQKTIYVHDG